MQVSSDEVNGVAAIIVAVSGLVASITALVTALRSHGKANIAEAKADIAVKAITNGASTPPQGMAVVNGGGE